MDDARTKYFSRSWKLMTKNKGWIKPILLLAVAVLVPVAGPLAMLGYALEWARLSAWGVDSSPKQRDVKIGACIASGWRGFVVAFAWGIVWNLVLVLITHIVNPHAAVMQFGPYDVVMALLSIVVYLVIYVAVMRATIYSKVTAGLRPARVFEMIGRDPKGLFKIAVIPIVTNLIIYVLGYFALFLFFTMHTDEVLQVIYVVSYATATSSSVMGAQILSVLGDLLVAAVPMIVVFGYVILVVSVVGLLLEVNAIGLWISQFEVARWGGPSEPLPTPTALPPAPEPTAQPSPSVTQQAPAPVQPGPTDVQQAPAPVQAGPTDVQPNPVPVQPDTTSCPPASEPTAGSTPETNTTAGSTPKTNPTGPEA